MDWRRRGNCSGASDSVSEVFGTRQELFDSVQLSCQESEKQEDPERVVSARLGMGGGGGKVACCGGTLRELC